MIDTDASKRMAQRLPTVIVAGSLHYDIMVDAPDRPRKGETVAGSAWAPKCGGKGGNQAVAAARSGVQTAMVGTVGRDDFGKALLANLDAAGVDRSSVEVTDRAGSGMSVAIFDEGGDYGAVIVSGANLAVSADQIDDARLANARVLVLQNEILETVNHALARRARGLGVTVILNAAPARVFATALPEVVDVLVVNAIEAEMLSGGPVHSLESALDAARILASAFGTVLVTAGGDGVAAADRGGLALCVAGIPVVVASTHGAGDAFVGTLAAALAKGNSLSTCIEAANAEAGRLVSTPEADRR